LWGQSTSYSLDPLWLWRASGTFAIRFAAKRRSCALARARHDAPLPAPSQRIPLAPDLGPAWGIRCGPVPSRRQATQVDLIGGGERCGLMLRSAGGRCHFLSSHRSFTFPPQDADDGARRDARSALEVFRRDAGQRHAPDLVACHFLGLPRPQQRALSRPGIATPRARPS
jgi:hypothetical protein